MVRGPRGSTRSVKYIVDQAGASEASGLIVVTICNGVDNATLGQTGPTDTAIPTGAKIVLMDLRFPKVNLGAATANFIHWQIQRTNTGQSIVSPITGGGNALRKNVMLSGVIGLGAGQNNSMHICFKVPKRWQRIADGDTWSLVMNNGLAVSAVYQFIYKVFQ